MRRSTATVTPGQIQAGRARAITGRYAEADTGAMFRVVSHTHAGPVIEGVRTGAVGRLVQTGRQVRRDGQVRVRIEFARDIGDAAGTLAFDNGHVGAWAPHDVFATQ